jgi:uncharacterized protein
LKEQNVENSTSACPSGLEFKPSSIHGVGGFVVVPISKGSRVIEYVGERLSKSESLVRCQQGNPFIFYLDENWNLEGNVEWNPARFINHSCEPNCEAELIEGRIWLIARRDISAGEEITFDYGFDLDDYREHPCHCGSAQCYGYILARELRKRQ